MLKKRGVMTKFLKNITSLYVDGFRNMTLGRVLWAVIAIKLIIMFGVLKVFVYDTSLSHLGTSEAKSQFVLGNLTRPALDFKADFKPTAENLTHNASDASQSPLQSEAKSNTTAHEYTAHKYTNPANPATHANPTHKE